MNILLLDCSTNVAQILEKLQSGMSESQITNCHDSFNVFVVCVAIVAVAIYGIRRYFKYKTIELDKYEDFEKIKHTWEVDSAKCKRQNELLDKKLDILKELSYQPKKDAEKIPIQDNVNKYIEAINEAIAKI